MFSIRVQSVFSAAHALTIGGQREPLHGHDWRVAVTLTGPELDADGLLWDFHALQADVEVVIVPFRNANLNETRPFCEENPSAEAVARHIGVRMSDLLRTRVARYPKSVWADGLRIDSVEVTEAPGCAATWHAPRPVVPTDRP